MTKTKYMPDICCYQTPLDEVFSSAVDQCLPLLVGVLPDKEDEDEKNQDEKRKEVFLRVKLRHLLEVDVQSGQERCRLELDCLASVDATQAAWTHRVKSCFCPLV